MHLHVGAFSVANIIPLLFAIYMHFLQIKHYAPLHCGRSRARTRANFEFLKPQCYGSTNSGNSICCIIRTTGRLDLKAVRTIIPELAGYKKPAEEASDTLTAEEAIVFLQAMGYPTTLSNLYGLTFRNAIPYRKVRRRLVFSRTELTKWIEAGTLRPEEQRAAAALRIAQSANNQQ